MFAPAPKLWEGADFSSASGDFKALGAFFCNSAALSFLPESRTVNRAPVYHILWSRGFRDTTISGRGSNLSKPLRRHFEPTPFCRPAPRAAIPATERGASASFGSRRTSAINAVCHRADKPQILLLLFITASIVFSVSSPAECPARASGRSRSAEG